MDTHGTSIMPMCTHTTMLSLSSQHLPNTHTTDWHFNTLIHTCYSTCYFHSSIWKILSLCHAYFWAVLSWLNLYKSIFVRKCILTVLIHDTMYCIYEILCFTFIISMFNYFSLSQLQGSDRQVTTVLEVHQDSWHSG